MVLGLVHYDHDVIGRLVVYQQLAVAVADDAARGELHLLQEGIRVGILLVVIAHQLQGEEPDDIHDDDDCCHGADDILPIVVVGVFHFLRTFSMTMMSTTVSTVLPTTVASHHIQLTKLKNSSVK